MTSFQAVARIRRLFSLKKVGHCGTLDPFADGVLTLCLARSTAAVQYMDIYDKSYVVTFRLGRMTDTQDLEGETVEVSTPSGEDIAACLADDARLLRDEIASMSGKQMQTPPIYSALKLDGRPLYSYARAGETVDLSQKRREITVISSRFLSAKVDPEGDPLAPLEVKAWFACSKGTYIRTLVHDLGIRLGFGAYCTALTRDSSGPYKLEDSITLEEIEAQMPENPEEHPALGRIDQALLYLPMIELNEDQAIRFANGQFIDINDVLHSDLPLIEADTKSASEIDDLRTNDEFTGKRETGQVAKTRFRVLGPRGLIGVGYMRMFTDGPARLAAERVFIRANE